MAHGVNPTKTASTEKFLPRIQEMLDGWRKVDPPTKKMLPIEADVLEHLLALASFSKATEKDRAVADIVTIAFFYLLRIGEITAKGRGERDEGATQTQPFRMKDVAFFGKHSTTGRLYRIHPNARKWEILNASSTTLKLTNQKNGWKGVCVNHEHSGDASCDGVRAIGRRYVHIRDHTSDPDTPLFRFFEAGGTPADVTDQDIREAIKSTAIACDYPGTRGTPIELINTHSLRIGGACALALAGFTDTQIMKMGRWRGQTFQEYIRENLSNYSEGMSKAMKKKHFFVNIDSGTYTDVSAICEETDYGGRVEVAATA